MRGSDPMDLFHPALQAWFGQAFPEPTAPQAQGWPVIARGDSTLVFAPTGSGKTLAAFLWCINRLMFAPVPPPKERCRVLYVSPLKALAVDVERNLRSPIAGIGNVARARGDAYVVPGISVRTGDTPASDRARFLKDPADILITTPESLFLLLTSRARDVLRSIETVIVDEIHALVPTKRGAHLALSLERLEALSAAPPQRIGLSATQRPLDEVARFLGGTEWREPAAAHAALSGPAQSPSSAGPAGNGKSLHVAKGGSGRRSAIRARNPGPSAAIPEARDASVVREDLHDEFEAPEQAAVRWRPVTIVDAREPKRLELRVEVPVEDLARLAAPVAIPSGPASQGPGHASIWTSIHPRLVEIIRAHRSTLLFVNSRRLAERLAAALNEVAGEPLVRSHHGSIARTQRIEIEDALKAGQLRALVATSSLELGIDMGAIDMVVQIEAPPSVASGMQRIGRASHQVGAVSSGIIFPKYRGDLLACAAVTRAMHEGEVESTRFPRNPLDVLAQQIVAMVAMEPWDVDRLLARVRSAAPFHALSRRAFEGVLDMLSGRYPSDEFAELKARLTWDRIANTLTTREGSQRVAIANAGTIPDRGLYGVFLAGAPAGTARVGELDEEMVFESRVGETFLLGASSWRIEQITHDRVLVSPAPGEPGKMPFWKGDGPGRPRELGMAIGRLVRELREVPPATAIDRLIREHDLDRSAAENLRQYLDDQAAATGAVPDERTVVIERVRDELGDWRVCLLSPLGGRVLAPWALAAVARVRNETGIDAEVMWTDDGFVMRLPDTDAPPDPAWLVPPADEGEALVVRQLGSSALFAARFREVAGRALLLPRRRAGARTPLWQQRKRASDLLSVAARFGSFPALLETYREVLRDVFDMPALVDTLRQIEARSIRLVTVDAETPSPFASSLLFGYVANFLYDGDAPLAERRAQALSVDHTQLRELLGDAELRELLDPGVMAAYEAQLQHLDPRYHAKTADALHDLLLRVGDLTRDEIAGRSDLVDPDATLATLTHARRLVRVPVAGSERYIAVEDAARYRDALGTPLPTGLPEALLEPVRDPLGDLVLRFARTHAPFTTIECARRFALGPALVEDVLTRLSSTGRVLSGAFRPGGREHEWCASDVLRTIRQRSLARLRHEVEPVDGAALGRLVTAWQGVVRPRAGLDALLDAVEQLQGAALPFSVLESEVLPARVEGYRPADLDVLMGAGEVVWVGVEPIGDRDGRVALYLTDHLGTLAPQPAAAPQPGTLQDRILAHLALAGASFFPALHAAVGSGFPQDVIDALWDLVWSGHVTNDSLFALRAFILPPPRTRRDRQARAYRSRRVSPPTAQGRWSLLAPRIGTAASATAWATATAQQLLNRHGLLTREAVAAEGLRGGFSTVYEILKAMEDSGRIRRGLFVGGLGATQFALPAALDLLRSLRDEPEEPQTVHLSATDPANPYGAVLKWPAADPTARDGRGPIRTAGATVILVNGALAAYLARGDRQLTVYLPEDEPARSVTAREVARRLHFLATSEDATRSGLLLGEVNGITVDEHPLARHLSEAGFVRTALGYQAVRKRAVTAHA